MSDAQSRPDDDVSTSTGGVPPRRLLGLLLRIGLKSLLAFAIVVAVVAFFGPAFTRAKPYGCRSLQSEAKGNLKGIFVAQSTYLETHKEPASTLTQLDWTQRGARRRYRFELHTTEGGHWFAEATGLVDRVEGDVWRIDDEEVLTNVQNACNR